MAESPFIALRTTAGYALLLALSEYSEERAAAAAQRARSLVAPEVAAAALATSFSRRRARAAGKFAHPERMLFTRAGYEQASSEAVAAHRGERFAGLGVVADLCCGIGSDSSALAKRSDHVVAVDCDADAIACAEHNAAAMGVREKITFRLEDAMTMPLEGVDAAFADPSRRTGAVRARTPDAYSPPLELILARARDLPGGKLCVKVAPGIDFAAPGLQRMLEGLPLEIEVVSERGTCKEAVFWRGDFARANGTRRATVIDHDGAHALNAEPDAPTSARPLGAYLGEPDPAVVRAGLIAALGVQPIDVRVAYVTADSMLYTPFVRWYRVRDAIPFGVKRMRAYLRAHGIGDVVVKTRAFPLRPDEIVALLKARGTERATLVCTTIAGRKTAIVCDPIEHGM